jgi:hypothetical protein
MDLLAAFVGVLVIYLFGLWSGYKLSSTPDTTVDAVWTDTPAPLRVGDKVWAQWPKPDMLGEIVKIDKGMRPYLVRFSSASSHYYDGDELRRLTTED